MNRKYIRFLGSLLLMTFVLIGAVQGQEKELKKKRTRHRIGYFNLADSVKYIQSYLYVSEKGVKTEIAGATVGFFAVTDTGEVFVGESVSDAAGKAILRMDQGLQIPVDTTGQFSIIAKFDGNKTFKPKEADLDVRDLDLNIKYSEKDSIRKVIINAKNVFTGKNVEDLDIKIFVKRLFSPLLIGDISTNKKGKAELEFPDDLPGNEQGLLEVSVKIVDNDEYGNYEANEKISWGVPIESRPKKLKRALWNPNAPLWMVIVFFVMMVTVWGHYLIIAIALQKVKNESRNNSSEIHWDS